MIRKVVIILLLLLIAPYAGALEPPIGNVPPPEILEEYLPSPQIPVDTAPGGSIGLLKYLPDGSEVEIAGKVVSGVVSPYIPVVFYVQEPDRSAGIRVVVWESVSLSTGEVVDISGILDTMDGERLLRVRANQIAPCSVSTSVEPVLISLASVGGDVAGYQPAVVLRVPTAEEPVGLKAVGVNNVGLLVKIYGKVTAATDDYFYLDDGSDVYVNARDTSHDRMDQHVGSDLWDGTNLGVRVRAVDLWEQPSAGDFVGVVGIVGARLDSENRVLPLLQPRGDADVSEPDTVSLDSPSDRIVPEQGGGTRWNLTCLPLPIAFDIAHSSQYPPRAYYFMGEGYLWTYSGLHHAQKQLPVDPEDDLKPISNFTHGAGYWLRLYGSGVSYQAVDDDVTDRWISLPYPWYNLFGHPLNHDMLWSDLKVTDGKRMAGLQEAWFDLQWVGSVGVWWEPQFTSSRDIGLPDDYAYTETMESWHGYHMYAAKSVALIVPGQIAPDTPRGGILATVTDASQNPLIGARVYCKYGSALSTEPNGTALIEDLPVGDYLVTASAQGYKSKSQLVTVIADNTATPTFVLEGQGGITLGLDANPTRIPPDGISTSTITVYTADREGVPLSGKNVSLSTSLGTLNASQVSTDDAGSAADILTASATPGVATITATCEGQTASIQVQFRTIIYVKTDGSDTNSGLSWALAKEHLSGTLGALLAATAGGEIWVAGDSDHPYEENITLKSGVGLYGGFDGTESHREDRDWRENETILDGGGSETSETVVTSPEGAGSDTIVDGFTITNGLGQYAGGVDCTNSSPTISNNTITSNQGTGESVSGGGIYCYASSAKIQGNIIRGNTSSTVGGGICCQSCPYVSIINNQIDQNAAQFSGSAIYSDSPAIIASNTIADNAGGGGVYAVYLSGASTTVANNIIAFNQAGVYGDSSTLLANNDVCNNPETNPNDYYPEELAHDTDIPDPPSFVDDYHLTSSSPCKDAGNNDYADLDIPDIDGEYRVQDGVIDIGADEVTGCTWYHLTLSVSPPYVTPGQTAVVTAHLDNWHNHGISGVTVCFLVVGGTITQINGLDPTSGCGETDVSGNVTAVVTRDTPGNVTVTAQVENGCGGEIDRSAVVHFYAPGQPVEIFFCIDSTGSMADLGGEHRATSSVAKLLNDLGAAGVPLKIGGVKFNEPGDYLPSREEILSGAPGQPEGSSQLSSLSDFTDIADLISGWVHNGYSPYGGDFTELQLDALHLAAEDMNDNSASGNPNKYIVLITDYDYHYKDDGSGKSTLTEDEVRDELEDSGCAVYVSLWEDQHQWDSCYEDFLVNDGEFDPCDRVAGQMEDKYPFTRLRSRILGY